MFGWEKGNSYLDWSAGCCLGLSSAFFWVLALVLIVFFLSSFRSVFGQEQGTSSQFQWKIRMEVPCSDPSFRASSNSLSLWSIKYISVFLPLLGLSPASFWVSEPVLIASCGQSGLCLKGNREPVILVCHQTQTGLPFRPFLS